MSNIALLVDCHKIINWLDDRKKLRKDWYNYLKAGEEKLKSLLKDRDWTINYPNIHDYFALHEQSFSYNDIVAIVDLLLQTDLAQKNLLFGYSDKRVKEWTTLRKYMENNSLSLLSVAKFIEQSLKFDLPALNKSIELLDNQLATLRRKIDFNKNTIFQQNSALLKEKVLLGVESEIDQKIAIQKLIIVLIAKAPQQIKRFQEICRNATLANYLSQFNIINEQNQTPNNLLALSYFLENGDDFLEVYKGTSKRQEYANVAKYTQFENWKGSNQWQIQIQGFSSKNERKLEQSTVLQSREFRQSLLYDLSQLQFFYRGLKFELGSAGKGLGFEAENFKNMSLVEGDADTAISTLQNIILFLTSKRLTAPLELKNSKKAYQILVSQFGGYEANLITMQQQISAYKLQIIELEQRRQQEVQKLNWLRAKVVGSKSKCETWLTDLVRKQVKITGEINKLE